MLYALLITYLLGVVVFALLLNHASSHEGEKTEWGLISTAWISPLLVIAVVVLYIVINDKEDV
jgi:hypothetical protein